MPVGEGNYYIISYFVSQLHFKVSHRLESEAEMYLSQMYRFDTPELTDMALNKKKISFKVLN